jgi:hypothetical protein
VNVIGEEIPLEPQSEGRRYIIDPYRLMSIPATIRHEDERLLEALRWHLSPFAISQRQRDSFDIQIVQTREDRDGYPWRLTYVRGGKQLFRGSPYRVLDYALWDLHALVHREARDFLFLHAGAVAGDRQRLILPAEPGTGKSTLVASLLRDGFLYLSDELAPIDPVTTGVFAFPKHIAVSNHGLEHIAGGEPDMPEGYPELSRELPDRHLRPTDLGSGVGKAGHVDAIVFLAADRNGPPVLNPISRPETIARLLGHALNAELYGDRGLKMLARTAASAEAFELTGGSSADRAGLLRHRFS